MNIAVIGQGYVGLTLSIGAAKVGHKVIGLDINQNLISQLKLGNSDVLGVSQKDLNQLITRGNYSPTTDVTRISESDIIVIAVPTPLDSSRKPDLSYVRAASEQIAQAVTTEALIINESTSFPGTLRNVIKPTIESISNTNFLYASAPERIDPGNLDWNLNNTPRVVGGLTEKSVNLAIEFYETMGAPVFRVNSPEVAEAAKLFENTFRQINIALANEFSIISKKLGFSTNEAIQAASTKPFGFMPFFPSIGVGGHCIPVDPSYLSYAANQVGVQTHFIELANSTNLNMVDYVVDQIRSVLVKDLSKSNIQIAGIAYKPGVSDLRESPALDLVAALREEGVKVTWCDPLVKVWNGESSSELSESIDLGLIVTPHSQIDFTIWKKTNVKVLDLSANSNNYGWPKFL